MQSEGDPTIMAWLLGIVAPALSLAISAYYSKDIGYKSLAGILFFLVLIEAGVIAGIVYR